MSSLRLLRLLPLLFLCACSIKQPLVPIAVPALRGLVRGGQQPVSGSTIQLYAVGTTGDGSSATPLLNPAPQSDSYGNFNITGTYTCPSASSLVYILATGGNPGLAVGTDNSAISLMAALGPCGNLSSTTFININEITTVAAINPLAPFTTSPYAIGSSPTDSGILAQAFTLANQYANTSTGTSPGLGVPVGVIVPTAAIDTLADILATCVNSAGGTAGDLTSCGNLFSFTTPSGTAAATDTLTAALDVASSPTLNTAALFTLPIPSAPFQPVLTVAPPDFSTGLIVNSGLQPSASTVSFAISVLGSPPGVQSLTLTNNSQSPITISGISIYGINAADFTQTNNCPASLAAAATCTSQITFTPSATGVRKAVISIVNGSVNSPLLVGLSGIVTNQAITAPQLLSISPASVFVGSPGATITITGTGFTSSSTVYFKNFPQPTTYISPQSVSFTLGAQYLSNVGSYSLTARNSSFISNALTLQVVNPLPTLISISPAIVIAGSPSFSLTVSGSGISNASSVVVNGVSHQVSFPNGATSATVTINASEIAAIGTLGVTIVNPTPGGGTSASLPLQVISAANRLRTLNYSTLDIVSDPIHSLLYASVSSTSTTSPNSIVAIDPLQGTVVTTQAMPAQPGQLAVTDDGSYLYVSLPATGQISRLILPSLTPDISWSLGTDGGGHVYSAQDLEAAPGQPHTVAVTRTVAGAGTGVTGGIAIYDDGVARTLIPGGTYPFSLAGTIAWNSDATMLFATSGGPEYIYTVNQNGPTLSATIPLALSCDFNRLTFDKTTGRLYDGCGDVVDALTGASVGKLNVQNTISYDQNPFAIDAVHGKAFFLDSNYFPLSNGIGTDIQAFDLNTLSFIDSIYIPNLSGSKLVQWGTSGLATAGGNQIFIFDGSFVSTAGVSSPIGSYVAPSPTLTSISPQTVPAGSNSVNVTLSGVNFSQAEVVTWNGQTIPSSWQSATQVIATIPASLLTQPVAAALYISNGPGTENSNGLPFTVLPDLGPNTQIAAMDLSGQDMVWDSMRNLLYVAVTDSGAVNGNSIAVVDPARVALQNVVYIGNQPSALGISDDDQYLYAGLQTATLVKRFKLSDFSLDLTIPLNSGIVGESFAGEVKVAPGQPQTIAVSMGSINTEPRDGGGVAIFDNATQRPVVLQSSTGTDSFKLAWGKDATRLYAHSDPEFQSQTFSVLAVDSTGVSAKVASVSSLGNLGLRPHYDAGTNLVYSDDGRITNPTDATAAGVLESRGLMVPDSTLNRAFVLSQGASAGVYVLNIFDINRLTLLQSITIPGVIGYPTQLVRWSSQGLAFLTDSQSSPVGMLYILQGSDISGLSTPPNGAIALSPKNVIVGTATGATITVTGTNFLSTSSVLVNGAARATTFVSATQLTFQLTAVDQAFANYLSVVVTNSATGGSTSPASSLEVDNPVPTITSLNTPILPLNSSDTVVAINGSGFVPTTIARLNGSPLVTTYVSPTQVTAVVPTADLATAGKFALTTFNPGPGGGSSAASTLEVDNPVPVITGLSPSSLPTGAPAQAINVFGSGFIPSTVVQIGGTPRTTTYVTSTQISVLINATDIASQGSVSLRAVNPAPGGGSSAAASLAINNSVPPGPITLVPNIVTQGATTPTSITVNGSNFVPGSYVLVGTTGRTTTYISPTQLTFLLEVADQATVATLHVAVVNPAPGGGSSTALLTVAAPTLTPVISSLSPTQFVQGSSGTYLQVLGSNFTTNSVIQWNGTPLPNTFFISSGNIEVFVPTNLLAATGAVGITVNSVTATPSLSNAVSLSIVNPPAPTLTSISPTFGPINTAFTATLTGANFTAGSTVAINGMTLPTTFGSSTQLTVFVPASNVGPGNSNFTVTTPAPGGGASAAVVFTAYIPVANNSMIYNPVNGLFYLSIPGSAGPPYANSVVSLDPVTGALGTPIFVGSEPNRLALTSDGRYLWVGLDGAGAVRKVDLVAQVAGLQFPLPTSSNYSTPLRALALAAVPGQTDSVIVSAANQYSNSVLALYDSGIPRGNVLSLYSGSEIYSLQVNGSLNEIYAAFSGTYAVYTYGSSGLSSKLSVNPGSTLVLFSEDRIQLASGLVYTDYSSALNAETGALAGTFGSGPTNVSTPIAIDPTLGLAFVLNSSAQYSSVPNRIQLFNLSDYSAAGTTAIPVNIANNYSPINPASDLTRWGTNGLALRNGISIYALRSNLVKDLSASPADLGVAMSSSGPNLTGTQTTYTATISNAGPSNASEVSLTALLPSTGVLVSATPSSGTCTAGTSVICDLGALVNGATATVSLTVNQRTPGTSTMTVQVSASQADPNPANNQTASTATITGATYTAVPTLLSITPSTVLAGSSDTAINVAGTGFGTSSVIQVDGVALPTNLVSPTQLSVTVPAASVAALGWHSITVSNPAPGGGVSSPTPLSVYNVIKAGANHILYEPFSRNILATLGSAMPSGNSIEAITPDTGALATPVFVGSEPTRMTLSDDGQILYVLATGSSRIVRYNMLAQQPGATFDIPTNNLVPFPELVVQPGSENTLALTPFSLPIEIVDFDPVAGTFSVRPSNSGTNSGSSPRFLNSSTLFVGSGSLLQSYTVTSSGLNPLNIAASSSVIGVSGGPFKLVNGIAFTSNGGVTNVTTQPATQLGTFPVNFQNTEASVAPDPTLGRVFFLAAYDGISSYTSNSPTGIAAFDSNTFQPAAFVPLNLAVNETTLPYTAIDVIRWGQDGIAALTNSGTIYLLRGPAVVPQLLQTNTPPVLSASLPSPVQHGSGNTVLMLSGSNFLPGIAVTWNGTYRTTTLVDANHITVDIPAADLISPGTASIVATNPGSASSIAVTVPVY